MSTKTDLKVVNHLIDVLEATMSEVTDSMTKSEFHTELAKANSSRAKLEMQLSAEENDPDPDLPSVGVIETSMKHGFEDPDRLRVSPPALKFH